MKVSDFTSTSSEREAESQGLLHTERTDAVNAGIVDSAGNGTEGALRGGKLNRKASRKTSRTPPRGGSRGSDAAPDPTGSGRGPRSRGRAAASGDPDYKETDGGTNARSSASRSGRSTRARNQGASEAPQHAAGNARTGGMRGAGKTIAARGVHSALRGSELEGADDLYYEGRTAVHVGRWARRKLSLSGRAGSSAARKAGGTQGKPDAAKAAQKQAAQRKSQMTRYHKQEVYTNAAKTKTANRALAPHLGPLTIADDGGSRALLGTIGAGGCLPLTALFAIILLFLILAGALGGNEASNSSSTSLTATEQQVAAYLMSQGLDELHTAAIMGNMYAESGMDPTAQESTGTGIGLCQWSYSRASALRTYAASLGKSWTDLSVQLDFFWNEDIWATEWSSTYVITQCSYDGDPAVGETVSGSKSGFLATDDLEEAVKEFCYGWERPGTPRINVRLEAAQRYYTALTSGSYVLGEDYADAEEWQQAIVDAAISTPSPGADYCAMWVSTVYQNAGLGYIGGNACCMYLSYCTSSDADDLEVGMLVAVQQTTSSHGVYNNGHLGYGHVGIYVGDGYVISSKNGTIVTETLEEFADDAYTGCTVKWGWPSGVSS